jgi:3-hydroxybutyryl-CoA dehydrogenase
VVIAAIAEEVDCMEQNPRTPIRTVSIIGAGFMGWQIALQCAVHGFEVWMVDSSDQALQHASGEQARELRQRVDAGTITASEESEVLARVRSDTRIDAVASKLDIVVEAIPERLELKRNVFAELDRVCPERTILATNSSSMRISAIEDATRRPDRVLNMHFFIPVWERPLVELMRGTLTSNDTLERARSFAETIGMLPLIVRKESTGFILNRVWRAIKKECLTVVEEGAASAEDVDRAWMIVMGHPAGPFGIMDKIGLDVVRDVENVYFKETGNQADAPPHVLTEKVARGKLGVKTGKGFYSYPQPAYEDPGFLKPGEYSRSGEETEDDG